MKAMICRKPVRIGYGMDRRMADFAEADVERVWIDAAGTDRMERAQMLTVALRPGDTLVLLAMSDLGAGKGLRNIREMLAKQGVEIEVVKPAKAEPPRPRGRPRGWQPAPEDAERFERLWLSPVQGDYVVRKVCEARGWSNPTDAQRNRMRNWLARTYGPRTGSQDKEPS